MPAPCRDHDVARSFSATSLSTIVEFVANGQGITLLPAISLRKEAADRRIALHALAAPGAGRMLRLVWRQDTPFGKLFEEIAEVIRDLGETRLAEALPVLPGGTAEDFSAGSPRVDNVSMIRCIDLAG